MIPREDNGRERETPRIAFLSLSLPLFPSLPPPLSPSLSLSRYSLLSIPEAYNPILLSILNFTYLTNPKIFSLHSRLKIYRLPNFYKLFQFLRKSFFHNELFWCLQKVVQVMSRQLHKVYSIPKRHDEHPRERMISILGFRHRCHEMAVHCTDKKFTLELYSLNHCHSRNHLCQFHSAKYLSFSADFFGVL